MSASGHQFHDMRAGRAAQALIVVMAIALALRMFAGAMVQRVVDRADTPRVCLFPDAEYYWLLARTIRQGAPFDIVEWGTIHHYALRTPGYPIFLAACQAILGERPLGVRLVQAGLGALTVWLVYRLTREVVAPTEVEPVSAGRFWTVPLIAAAIAALNPYYIAMSELILSEAVFVPLMLLTLWGLAVLWGQDDEAGSGGTSSASWRFVMTALATGVAGGAAILTRPSWALFLPGALLAWVVEKVWRRGAGCERGRFKARCSCWSDWCSQWDRGAFATRGSTAALFPRCSGSAPASTTA